MVKLTRVESEEEEEEREIYLICGSLIVKSNGEGGVKRRRFKADKEGGE